jgi:hypothetical protein
MSKIGLSTAHLISIFTIILMVGITFAIQPGFAMDVSVGTVTSTVSTTDGGGCGINTGPLVDAAKEGLKNEANKKRLQKCDKQSGGKTKQRTTTGSRTTNKQTNPSPSSVHTKERQPSGQRK